MGAWIPLKKTCTPPSVRGACPCTPGWYTTPVDGPIPYPTSDTTSPGAITPSVRVRVAPLNTDGVRQAGVVQPGSPKRTDSSAGLPFAPALSEIIAIDPSRGK